MKFQIINEEVRNALLPKGVTLRCKEATRSLVTKSNGELVHYAGFHGWETHNWAVDPVTGNIYDPTMEQFGHQWQPVIGPDSELAKLYIGTPQEEVQYWAPFALSMVRISHVVRYLRFKESLGRPIEKRGHSEMVEKLATNGKPYLLIQKEVQFTSQNRDPQLRSATIWKAKNGGHNAYVLTQRCVETKNGKIIFPVKRTTYYIPQNLRGLIPIRKGKCQKVVRPFPWKYLAEVISAAKSWK